MDAVGAIDGGLCWAKDLDDTAIGSAGHEILTVTTVVFSIFKPACNTGDTGETDANQAKDSTDNTIENVTLVWAPKVV